ncbi:hypothetical protein LCGC14_2508930, partial [marine sediment metagenome]
FHMLSCPDYTQVDHINRDGLDNRSFNLREGVKVNPKNKGQQKNNNSGVTGVYYQDGKYACWCTQIGGTCNRRTRRFSIQLYGYDEARKMAIKVRNEWEKELEYGKYGY